MSISNLFPRLIGAILLGLGGWPLGVAVGDTVDITGNVPLGLVWRADWSRHWRCCHPVRIQSIHSKHGQRITEHLHGQVSRGVAGTCRRTGHCHTDLPAFRTNTRLARRVAAHCPQPAVRHGRRGHCGEQGARAPRVLPSNRQLSDPPRILQRQDSAGHQRHHRWTHRGHLRERLHQRSAGDTPVCPGRTAAHRRLQRLPA